MSIPSAAQTALDAKSLIAGSWLEIEGIPYAYGTWSCGASLWSLAGPPLKFLGIRPSLSRLPKFFEQTIDTLKGGNLTSGAVQFEITDVDGEPIKWTNLIPVGTKYCLACTDTATLIQLDDNTGLSVGQYLYVGTETWKIASIGVSNQITVERGAFRSKPQAYPSYFPVSTAPYCMANRRVWFYQVFDNTKLAPGSFTQDSTTLNNRVLRFSGVLRQMVMKNGDPNTFVLSAESLDREIDRDIFTTLRSFKASTSIKDGRGAEGMSQVSGMPGYSAGWDLLYPNNTPSSKYTLNEYLMVRIDEEFFAVQVVSLAPLTLKLLARGLLNTAMTAHKAEATVQEVVALIGKHAPSVIGQNQSWMELCSKFSGAPPNVTFASADHPVVIALTVRCSTGTGTNNPLLSPVRAWDVLPAGWGLGIAQDRIDWNACEAAAREDPSLRFGGVIEEPINAVDFLRQLLTFAGYYFTIETGDKFVIRRLRPPLPDAASKTITQANRIRDNYTSWDANLKGAVRELVFKFGWDTAASKFKRITVLRLGDGDIYSKGIAQTLTFESKLIYPGASAIPGEPPFTPFDVDQWLLHRRDFFNARYGRPPPIIRERVDYSFMGTEVGEIVLVTHPWLPDLAGGRLNGSGIYGEVIGKSIDDVSRTVDLTILLTRYTTGAYRYFAPSLEIIDIGSLGGADWRINALDSQFTGVPQDLGCDLFLNLPGGTFWQWYANVAKCIWLKPDFSYRGEGDITNLASDYFDVKRLVGADPQIGDIIITPDFSLAGIGVTNYFGYLADTTDQLDSGPPHKLFPS